MSIEAYPVLPLKDLVIFPKMVVPLFVGRQKSIFALEEALKHNGKIILLTQKNDKENEPKSKDLYKVGILANVLQLLKLPDGTVKILVEGTERVKINGEVEGRKYLMAFTKEFKSISNSDHELLKNSVISEFEKYVQMSEKIPTEALATILNMKSEDDICDIISSHLIIGYKEKQKILEESSLRKRLELIFETIEHEISLLKLENKIKKRVKDQMDKTQKEYFLNEQMKAIRQELDGADENGVDEVKELEEKIKNINFTKEARDKALYELKKYKNTNAMSPEAGIIRNYLDWLTSIPWGEKTEISSDLIAAMKLLDKEHYGLKEVKERIIEYLAVQQRVSKIKGSILCLVGPPGVGKTSLGKSIAKTTGRNFVRMSLGGVKDESEIRGHRRTYVGAMPGKIVQSMKKAKSSNPLFLFDEVDKLGSDWRGDPSSALLEVLDSEQNDTFSDNYLEIDYDLSDVMFVCTANSLNMPAPLLDRMEIIRIAGYTEDEKIQIAKRHLIKKQMSEKGLKKTEFSIDSSAIQEIIRYYTREAGVRGLEREISKIARKAIKQILTGEKRVPIKITKKKVEEYLGVRKLSFGQLEKKNIVGVTTGLAWTSVGGVTLQVEAVLIPGKGGISMTGQLGDVMKESVKAAEMYIKSNVKKLGIKEDVLKTKSIHVHVPEGATPKDGPSAGVTMVTSLVSALTGKAVRRDVAMTGEITLRGRVLPIGGLKEKMLAAKQVGINTVIIPKGNVKDLKEVPENIKKGLEIIPVDHISKVLENALEK
ncbi:MAG: endopeptidase La [Alphaproteobacteria bacterium]|jgi:ATP-dependent Lon protease|nr:endopeptidase La [Alphaproteobacteria bacterium]MCV6599187.1 endopeptidase La [Alphaproteobacteria bacterium]